MKLKYGIGAVLASTLLVAGCTTDKGEIKAYNKNIQSAFDEEKSLTSVGKKLNKLEEKKQELVQNIDGKDEQKVKETSNKVVKNVDDRQQQFKKEQDAMAKSEKEFKKAEKHIGKIENKKKKKEVKQLNDAMKDKYKAHDKYAEVYENIMKKEKDMFNYTAKGQVDQNTINEKSKSVSKAYKEMNKAFKDYSKATNKVKTEKADVDSLA
ncbi:MULTISPECIES: YkyA family protein [Staphylococcus]|uniref:YkyA family protein n=1 Tax=Staphylococcus hsinchuensis TaxID=3051183 RepID=A0ABZ3EAE0_9STAP|nr:MULTISPECIES: YkyA family protein [unclassified Staphylococcus]